MKSVVYHAPKSALKKSSSQGPAILSILWVQSFFSGWKFQITTSSIVSDLFKCTREFS